MSLQAPFPWFGGKRKVTRRVWARFGRVQNYVEPFFGSGAVLLGRPPPVVGNETVNDADGFVANFWRAIRQCPEETAHWADYPVSENDLHARHSWLVGQRESLVARLEGDPGFCDAKVAGWWVWGLSVWIGGGFCSGDGPWVVDENRKLVHLGNNGRGVSRRLVHLGGSGRGVNRKLVHLGGSGRGVNRKLVHLGNNGDGRLVPWFLALSERLARVRVCSGDWSRVVGPSVTHKHGLTAVFLDPPYSDSAERDADIYRVDDLRIAHEVRAWAIEAGQRSDMRIALCGYEGEHEMPKGWGVEAWDAGAGYGCLGKEQTGNGKRERIWYSPACLGARQAELFEPAAEVAS